MHNMTQTIKQNLDALEAIKTSFKQILADNGLNTPEKEFSAYAPAISQYLATLKESAGDLEKALTGVITEVDTKATEIPTTLFAKNKVLTSVNAPNVEKIDLLTFYFCTALSSVKINSATSINSSAFSGCSELSELIAPKVTTLGATPFQDCAKITELNFPLCTNVGSSTAVNMSSLKSIKLPLGGNEMSNNAVATTFVNNCPELLLIEAPNLKLSNRNNANISNCAKLKRLVISGLASGNNMPIVTNCPNLTELVLYTSIRGSIASNLFTNTPIASGTCKVYVPDGMVSYYKGIAPFSEYSDQILPISELPEFVA